MMFEMMFAALQRNTVYQRLCFEQRQAGRKLSEEEIEKIWKEEIKKDQENIKQLKNPEQIEKYAREKYYMKKDSEDIYIIEFEGDTIEK